MQTKNKKYLNKKTNREYYKKSDGNFMPLEKALFAHKHLARVAWVRDKVYQIGSEKHLDLGCKDGYTCLTLQSEGIDCVGIDPSEDAIEEARLKNDQAKLDCVFIQGYAEDIPKHFSYFDSVSCMEVIEHVVDPDLLLQKIVELGAYLMLTTPDAEGRHGLIDSERNEEHLRMYTLKELEKLINKYYKIKESVLIDDQICILGIPK